MSPYWRSLNAQKSSSISLSTQGVTYSQETIYIHFIIEGSHAEDWYHLCIGKSSSMFRRKTMPPFSGSGSKPSNTPKWSKYHVDPTSHWFPSSLIHRPWRWRRHILPKRRLIINALRSRKSRNIEVHKHFRISVMKKLESFVLWIVLPG
jgi:hypothetical protein